MTVSTVIRSFNGSQNLVRNATHKNNPIVYGIKKFFYNLVTLGFGKSMDIARNERREAEITNVAVNVALNLHFQPLYSGTPMIVHTDFNKGYEIAREKDGLCLYTGAAVNSSFTGNHSFVRDKKPPYLLKSNDELSVLDNELVFVKQMEQYKIKIKEFNLIINNELEIYKSVKQDMREGTIKDKICWHTPKGNFDPTWDNSLGYISRKSIKIEQVASNNDKICNNISPFKLYDKNNDNNFVLVDGRDTNANGELRGSKLIEQVNSFFNNNDIHDITLEAFLNQPVEEVNPEVYKNILHNAKKDFENKGMALLYPELKKQLDNS